MSTLVKQLIEIKKPDEHALDSLRRLQDEYLLTPEEKFAVHSWLREQDFNYMDKRFSGLMDSLNLFN